MNSEIVPAINVSYITLDNLLNDCFLAYNAKLNLRSLLIFPSNSRLHVLFNPSVSWNWLMSLVDFFKGLYHENRICLFYYVRLDVTHCTIHKSKLCSQYTQTIYWNVQPLQPDRHAVMISVISHLALHSWMWKSCTTSEHQSETCLMEQGF